MTLNVDTIRRDFPILDQKVHDQPLVYLDNAASTQKPQQVIDTLVDYYQQDNANVYRGAHTLSGRATIAYENAREKVQHFIKAAKPEEVIFTRGTTTSLNWVAQFFKNQILKEGDEILISVMEHHSNFVPWQQVATETGATLKFIPITKTGELDLDEALAMINEKTKVLSISHVSNVLGIVNPIKQLADVVHDKGGYLVVDGAQAVPHMPVDVQDINADFYTFSGHKMLGPTGIGVLYGKIELLNQMEPIEFGGEMINHVSFEESIWKEAPQRFEAGTPNIAGAIGLGAAVDYLEDIGMSAIQQHEQQIIDQILPKIIEIEGVTVYGPHVAEKHTGVISFNIDGIHPHDVATAFDVEGVAIRAGHHCTEPLMTILDTQSTVRASFYLYNTIEEGYFLLDVIEKTKEFFNHGK